MLEQFGTNTRLSERTKMGSHGLLLWVVLAFSSPSLSLSCSERQLDAAQMGFRDCMEEKKGRMLDMEAEEVGDIQGEICNGLKDMSEGCQEAVQALAKCNGRERVDHIVAIHINAFTEVLSSVHTDVDILSCPVFHTPPPTIVSQQSAAPQPLGAEYVTGGSTTTFTISTFLILLSSTILLQL